MRSRAVGSEGREGDHRAPDSQASSPAVRSGQLLRFLAWLVPVVLVFAALEIGAYAWFRDEGSGVAGITLFVYGISLAAARALADRGGRGGALLVVCSGFLVAALVVVVAQPALVSVLTLAPLLAVGLALPHAAEHTLCASCSSWRGRWRSSWPCSARSSPPARRCLPGTSRASA